MGDVNFQRLYGHLSINELLADWQPVELSVVTDEWAGFPPAEFMDFIRTYPRIPFDTVPNASHHLKPPTFLMVQAHRIWLTASATYRLLSERGATSFLDVGSYPFIIPIVLRDFFGFAGGITVTTNRAPKPAGEAVLASKHIRVEYLDLDPFVGDPSSPDSFPVALSIPDGSFDLILSAHVIEHLYHPPKMLAECHRLLASDGRLLVSTDNAMMIDTLVNFAAGHGYIHEPVQHTAAMVFDSWRGHVRFFTSQELQALLERAGFSVAETSFHQCFYDVLFEDYFRNPTPTLPGWKRKMLAETPWLRNDVFIVGEKRTKGGGQLPRA